MTEKTALDVHSQTQLVHLERIADALLQGQKLSKVICYVVLSELSKHGSPFYPRVLDVLEQHDKDPRTAKVRDDLTQEYHIAVRVKEVIGSKFHDDYYLQLLELDKPVLVGGGPRLAVIFTTKFNNFYIANYTLAAMLAARGYGCLFLKDISSFQYLNGIPGLGSNWDSSMQALGELISKTYEDVVFTGFSSSSYAALMAALQFRPRKFVGFSISANLDPASPLPFPKLMPAEVREKVPLNLRIDLAAKTQQSDLVVDLFTGADSQNDIKHAAAFDGFANVNSTIIPGIGHIVIRPLLLQEKLIDIFL